jgi:hypothetical protein
MSNFTKIHTTKLLTKLPMRIDRPHRWQLHHPILPSFVLIDPADLIGRSFLKDQDNRENHHVHIVQLVEDHLNKAEGNPDRIKYLCKLNEGDHEELIAYNEILNYLENQEHNDLLWNFQRIVSHESRSYRVRRSANPHQYPGVFMSTFQKRVRGPGKCKQKIIRNCS